jgi:ribonuclease Z
MKFQLLILGCSSATPTAERHPSAQLLNFNETLYLIDCGEATQIQLRRNRIRIQRINHIFISHLHGDHYLGLTGLLSTMSILGRTNTLHIYASTKLKDIIDLQVQISDIHLNYEISWHFLVSDKLELLHSDKNTEVYSFPLNHRIPTHGFLFKYEVREKNFDKEILLKETIPHEEIVKIKKGADFISADGRVLKNEDLTKPGIKPISYAYCADTIYDESIVEYIKNVDLLYHETTFMQDMASTAREKFHSTTIDAANIAMKANAKQLIIGHYSARYDNLMPLLDETRTVFGNTLLAEEGKIYEVSV